MATRRSFKLDVLECPCGGRRAVIALIPSRGIATKILCSLKLRVKAARCAVGDWPLIVARRAFGGPYFMARATVSAL